MVLLGCLCPRGGDRGISTKAKKDLPTRMGKANARSLKPRFAMERLQAEMLWCMHDTKPEAYSKMTQSDACVAGMQVKLDLKTCSEYSCNTKHKVTGSYVQTSAQRFSGNLPQSLRKSVTICGKCAAD